MDTEAPVKRYRGQRGPNKIKRPTLVHVSMRLPQDVVDHFAGAASLSEEVRKVLTAYVEAAKG